MMVSELKAHKEALDYPDSRISFSQFGEDLVMWAILETHKRLKGGFYVDVGAFHPFKFSNTALLHLFRNWRGVNIDANAEVIDLFKTHRPGDFNVHAAVNDEETELEYVKFNRGGVNSLDPRMVEHHANIVGNPFTVKERIMMRTERLDKILDGVPDLPDRIDLLTVDCEGLDDRVLASNNWRRFKPFMVVVETHGMNLHQPSANPSCALLLGQGYRLISHAFVTSIFLSG